MVTVQCALLLVGSSSMLKEEGSILDQVSAWSVYWSLYSVFYFSLTSRPGDFRGLVCALIKRAKSEISRACIFLPTVMVSDPDPDPHGSALI